MNSDIAGGLCGQIQQAAGPPLSYTVTNRKMSTVGNGSTWHVDGVRSAPLPPLPRSSDREAVSGVVHW